MKRNSSIGFCAQFFLRQGCFLGILLFSVSMGSIFGGWGVLRAEVIISEVYNVSPSQTRVELYIRDIPNNTPLRESFPLSRLGLRTYYRNANETAVAREPIEINFYDVKGSEEYSLYKGVFYVLIFTNAVSRSATPLPSEYITIARPNPKKDKYALPAVTKECLSLELYWVRRNKSRETMDFLHFGAGCPDVAKSPRYSKRPWDAHNAPNLRGLKLGKSLARKIMGGPDYGFVHKANSFREANSFRASDWWVTDPSPTQPTDASCTARHPQDRDRDGIADCLEAAGQTFFGMPLYLWGARRGQMDLFLELDYMSCAVSNSLVTEPDQAVLQRIRSKFQEYKQDGIPLKLHIDVGELFGEPLHSGFNLGGGNSYLETRAQRRVYAKRITLDRGSPTYSVFYTVKEKHFNLVRKQLFYYMLIAEALSNPDQAGIAELGGNDALISIANKPEYDLDLRGCSLRALSDKARRFLQNMQGHILMHEFGHNLGLNHGGSSEDGINGKPNYFSVMNYLFSSHGVPGSRLFETSAETAALARDAYYAFRDLRLGDTQCYDLYSYARTFPVFGKDFDNFGFGFSTGSNGELNESRVHEASGFSRSHAANIVMDYNCDGRETSYGPFDLNGDKRLSLRLADHDDIAALRSFFARTEAGVGAVGADGVPVVRQNVFSDWQKAVLKEEELLFFRFD